MLLCGASTGASGITACWNWLGRKGVRIGYLPLPKLDVAGSNPVARFFTSQGSGGAIMRIISPVRHRAFTLLELVIVIIIIGLLIALILPSIS
jgi:prepilin-type N-terminal cleavage/methylation domain-containing protein